MTFQRLPRVPLLRSLILFTAVSALHLSLSAQTASDPKPPPVASPTDTTIESRAAQGLREFYDDLKSGKWSSTSSQAQSAPTPAPTPAPTVPAPTQPAEVELVETDVPAPAAVETTAPAPPLEPVAPPAVPVEEPVESPAVPPVERTAPPPAAVEMTAPAPPLEPVPPPVQPLQPRPAEPVPAPPVSPPAMSLEDRAAEALEHFYADPRRVKSSFPTPQFEPWPEPPPPLRPFPEPVQPVPTPPPTMPEAAEGRQLFSFRAENMDLKSALAVFARANGLNIVPDHDVIGQVTLDVVDLSLERIMQALLEAHDFTWTVEDGLIRVRTTETRTFVVDYLRLRREGSGMSLVTLSSASQGGGGGGGGRGGGGGGGGMSGGGGGMSGGAGGSMSGSLMNLTLENPIEFWTELEDQLQRLLSPRGRDRIAVNQTAGVIQVTDHPSALRKVEDFLSRMNESVTRQVDIEAKLFDVVLSDQFQFGIDWEHVVTYMGGQMMFQGTPTVTTPDGGFPVKLSALTAGFANENTAIVLTALQEQGDVRVISQPRLRTLNNQTAIMKVGQDVPFWTSFTVTDSSGGGQSTTSGDVPTTITVGTVLALTPQISTNGWITIDISPAISSLVEVRQSPSGQSSGPVLDIKQASTIVRLRDGETIVIGGLIQNTVARTRRKIPLISEIPLLGKLFTGHFDVVQKKELVIFLTPTVVR